MTVLKQPEAELKREDFPVESFRHMEAKLQEIRRAVMQTAAQFAIDATDPHCAVYRVGQDHIDQALKALLLDVDAAMDRLGYGDPTPRSNSSQSSADRT